MKFIPILLKEKKKRNFDFLEIEFLQSFWIRHIPIHDSNKFYYMKMFIEISYRSVNDYYYLIE